MKLVTVALDEFFEIPVSARESIIQDLADSLDSIFNEYTAFVASCGKSSTQIHNIILLLHVNFKQYYHLSVKFIPQEQNRATCQHSLHSQDATKTHGLQSSGEKQCPSSLWVAAILRPIAMMETTLGHQQAGARSAYTSVLTPFTTSNFTFSRSTNPSHSMPASMAFPLAAALLKALLTPTTTSQNHTVLILPAPQFSLQSFMSQKLLHTA